MNNDIYNPKKLLGSLLEMEQQLEQAMDKYCPHSKLSFDVDLDKALGLFLSRQDVKGNEVGFLSTQIALQHLRREIEKVKGIVTDTNGLRAWEDFLKFKQDQEALKSITEKNKTSKFSIGTALNYVMLGITVICVITTCYFFLFH